MPASTVSLAVVTGNSPLGPTFVEQNAVVSPGNNFDNGGGDVLLYARNTTASPINLIFESDLYGSERTVLIGSVPGSGTQHGVTMFGPFPSELFTNHSTTDGNQNGRVMVRQATGTVGQVQVCPIRVPRSLLR